MESLCKTCKNFMLVKIFGNGTNDVNIKDCLVYKGMFDNLRMGHFKSDNGAHTVYPNVTYCTHYAYGPKDDML